MSKDPYATKEESASVMGIDTRTPAEKELDAMIYAEIDRDDYDLMAYDSYDILRTIAIRLIEDRNAS